MTYIPNTSIWASENGKEIYYQDDPPKGVRAVLIASRGKVVNPFFVKKYGLKEQPQTAVVEPVPDVETVSERHIAEKTHTEVETKIVEPETPEKGFNPKRTKHERQ
jgi:hypothetical protein